MIPNSSKAETMVIHVRDLRVSYGRLEAVKGIGFDVPAGSVIALLGANGAGKSTTIGCLTTTVVPTAGDVTVGGHDVLTAQAEVRRLVGVVFQDALLDPILRVRENLTARAALYGIGKQKARERISELIGLLGLEEFVDRRYGTLSGGQKRRADIARALLHDPSILFLDEPTAGLDPHSREQIWATIDALRENRGMTVFLTTHYMEETERADDVRIMDHGRIVASGTPAELRARYSSSILTLRGDIPRLEAEVARAGLKGTVEKGDLLVPVASAAQAREILAASSAEDFEMRHGTMDDVFLAVTKEVGA